MTGEAIAAIVIGLAVIVVDGFDLQSIGFVAPEIARSWDRPLGDFGMVFGAGLLGTIPGAIFASMIANRIGRRQTLMLALLIMACGTAAGAMTREIETLAMVRFLGGVGMGAAYPLVIAIVADATPARSRSIAIAIAIAGQSVGSIVGAAACSLLIPAFGWPSAFWLGGALSLLMIPITLLLPAEHQAEEPGFGDAAEGLDIEQGGLLSVYHRPVTVHVWISATVSVILIYFVVNWVPGVLRSNGYTLQESLFAISLLNVGGILGGLFFGALSDRYGALFAVPLAYAVAAIFFGLFAVSLNIHLATYVVAFLAGFATLGAGVNVGAMSATLFPSRLRTASAGTALGIGRLVAAGASVGTGMLLEARIAQNQLFSIAAGLAFLAVINLLGLRRARSRQLASAHMPLPS